VSSTDGPSAYRTRFADLVLPELLATFPAVMVHGPRASGKTTTASRFAAQVVRLDVPGDRAAFEADPDAALARTERPVLLDEWQEVPQVLGAVKRAVDADGRPGRFLLAGSVRARTGDAMWPATGRVVTMTMYGLTERERLGVALEPGAGLVDRLVQGVVEAGPSEPLALPGYVERALRGTLPQPALDIETEERRSLWVDAYLEQLLTRDARSVQGLPDPGRLRRYFQALAASSAGLATDATLCDAAGISVRTARAYEALLEDLFVYDAVPAFAGGQIARLARARKRYLVDPAFVGSALRVTSDAALRDADLFGRLLETFVLAQLRPEAALRPRDFGLRHVRDRNGRHEVDIVVELGGGRVVAIEVKATAAPEARHADHLRWFRDGLGERFVAGVVMHTGPSAFPLGDRLYALPLSSLWA
jgi:predicted AAA+ superfamily ATPase